MRLISNEELAVVVGAGDSACTTTALPGGGTTTSCTLNGTSTVTTTYPNGNSTTVITRPDGHGTVISTVVETGGSGGGSINVGFRGMGGGGSGGGSSGTRSVTTVSQFSAAGSWTELDGMADCVTTTNF